MHAAAVKPDGSYNAQQQEGTTMNERLVPGELSFDPTLPLERARTLPRRWYFDPEIYEAEVRSIFHDTWQCVGRAEAVARPGAYLTADVAGEPIAVVRDQQGVLRAFYNVCRHRAAKVLLEPQGCVGKLRCRYHGWTYDLEGRLRGTPEFDGVCEFTKEDNGLVPVAVAQWGPFVFVHLGHAPGELTDYLAPLPQRTATLAWPRFVRRCEYEIACNWKVYVDNYLDGGYHVNTVHPALAGVLDYAQYRTETFAYCSVQSSPTVAGDPSDPTAAVRSGTAYYWWVFPNFMINLYAGIMDTNLVLPLGPDRCQVIFDFYFTDTEGEAAQARIEQSIAVAHQVQLEDESVCLDVQRGLHSHSYDTGRFSVKREAGGYHFHQLVGRRVGALWPGLLSQRHRD
jgi:choline monooxygenase